MSAIFLKRVFDNLKNDPAIQDKYIVAFTFWGEESVNHARIITSNYSHLLFRPRNSYKWPSETNDFCLEINNDPNIGKERFVIGVRRERNCANNKTMNDYITSSFKKSYCDNRRKPKELKMNKQHWRVWSFLGDTNQYCSADTDREAINDKDCEPINFSSLVNNSSIRTTTTVFISLINEWLLNYK